MVSRRRRAASRSTTSLNWIMMRALRWVPVVCLVVASLIASAASAQVDSASARLARAKLTEIEQRYGQRPQWAEWLRTLHPTDLQFELTAGEFADPAPLLAAAEQLRAPQLREPVFAELATALSARAKELELISREQWAAACTRAAEQPLNVSPESLVSAQRDLAAKLTEFQKRFASIQQANSHWHVFLHWPLTQRLVTNDPPLSPADFDSLEVAWTNVRLVWDHPVVAETALSVRSTIEVVRAAQPEPREQRAAAWQGLANAVQQPVSAEATKQVLERVVDREGHGDASALTRSIRAAYSHPNAVIQLKTAWLRQQVERPVNESFRVNGVYAGTRSTGNGRLTGNVTLAVVPHSTAVEMVMKLAATSQASSRGSRDGVTVTSRGMTNIRAQKKLTFGPQGMVTEAASANARTRITFDNIAAGGRAPRRNAAEQEVMASRGQAEADSSNEAERSAAARLDASGKKLADDFNRTWQKDFRDPWLTQGQLVPRVRVGATPDLVTWQCRLAPLRGSAANPVPPFDSQGDVTIQLATSAVEEHFAAVWGGATVKGETFARNLQRYFGSSSETAAAASDVTMTFDRRPCTVQFEAGRAIVQFRLTSFIAGEIRYPPLTIEVDYAVTQKGQGLLMRRDQLPRIRFLDAEGGATGRQQTLRLGVQRKVSRLLTEDIDVPSFNFGGAVSGGTFNVQRVQLSEGWLQMALVQTGKKAR
jgi:hypothetical protein